MRLRGPMISPPAPPTPPWVHFKFKVTPWWQQLRSRKRAGVFFSRWGVGGSQSHPSILPDVTRCAHRSSLGQMHLKRKISLEH